ncbi:MAG: FtsX-like permease family protein [Bacteroidota bacterium]
MKAQPPKRAIRFLRWFCKEDFIEEIEGDLVELFGLQFEAATRVANWTFFWWVLRYFRPAFLRAFSTPRAPIAMIRHNFLISYRGFLRDKTTFLINLLGLSTGLTCALLIYLWVQHERSIDGFHEQGDQLYQVMTHFGFPHGTETWDYATMLLAKTMTDEFPEVEDATYTSNRFFRPKGLMLQGENRQRIDGMFASPNFLELFSFPLLEGSPDQVLQNKHSLVISEALATQWFDSPKAAIGQVVEWRTEFFDTTFQITGVLAPLPSTSSLQFEALLPYAVLVDDDEHAASWNGTYARTYLKLARGTDVASFNQKIEQYMFDKTQRDTWEPATQFVQAYQDRYLYGEYEEGVLVGGRIDYVRLFSLIAIFILLIACINFMNLSTAQASRKMKEIGVKKTIGATRKHLIGQYLSESLLVVLISVFLALVGVNALLPAFSDLTGKALHLAWSTELIGGILILAIGTGLVAGSYPAFFLSGFRPVEVLKGNRSTNRGEVLGRKSLVILQFALSVVFIVSVIVVNRQIAFTQDKHLGYERDQIVCFQREPHEDDPAIFLNELRQLPGVTSSANMVWSILSGIDNGAGYTWSGDPEERDYLFLSPKMGYDAIETLGIEVIAGRSFSREFQDDYTKIIINEAAQNMMQLDDPVGIALKYGNGAEREIIGVVKDFQYGSLHQQVEPLIIRFRNGGLDYLVKMQAGTEEKTLSQIAQIYQKFHADFPFQYTFLDGDYRALYESEQRVATLSRYFALLAILISCLGLFGLAAFTAERRTKEIGIRKVLGAREWSIVQLLSREFTQMVGIAILIGLPVSYLVVHRWLEGFAYHIPLSWWMFALAGFLALLIAWLTVGVQTLRSAQSDPVESLRGE